MPGVRQTEPLSDRYGGVVVQLLSCVRLFAAPWTAACQASPSFTVSQSLLKSMSTESVMPSNHLILCCPLLFLPIDFPSIRVFSNESDAYDTFSFKKHCRDLPLAQGLRICLAMQGHGFNPWCRKIPHAVRRLSPCAATKTQCNQICE